MPLPILQVRHEPTQADLIRLFHRTDAQWVANLSEPAALDIGTAYANSALPQVWDANNLRDAALHGTTTPQQAMQEVEAHYSALGTRCAYWVMNPSAEDVQTRPLIDHLLASGYTAQVDHILRLQKIPSQSIPEVPGLKIIPARASYKHARELAIAKAAERWGGSDQLVEAYLQDLDNPHFDALLALKDDRPVACLGVLSVGELGRIESVYVAKEFRRQGIARAMMSRALEICARSLFKHIFILTEPANHAAQSLYQQFGFASIGQFTSYRAPVLQTETC
jgi:ribosomal-protein-alanine N-acetyltransferase